MHTDTRNERSGSRVPRPRAVKVKSIDDNAYASSFSSRIFGSSRAKVEAAIIAGLFAVMFVIAGSLTVSGLSLSETLSYMTESISTLADPDPEDLRSILAPWSSFRPQGIDDDEEDDNKDNKEKKDQQTSSSSSSSSPVLTRGGYLVQPRATLVLGWEHAIADPTCYDAKRGRYTSFRPGVEDLLLACANADIEVVIYSREYSASAVMEDLRSFIQKRVIPRDLLRYEEFSSFLRTSRARAIAAEHQLAIKEGRSAREISDFVEEIDTQPIYESSILRIAAVLGREHCFAPSNRALGLILSRRNLAKVLVVDAKKDLAEKEWKEAVQLHMDEGNVQVRTDEEEDRLDTGSHVRIIDDFNNHRHNIGGSLVNKDISLARFVKEALEGILGQQGGGDENENNAHHHGD